MQLNFPPHGWGVQVSAGQAVNGDRNGAGQHALLPYTSLDSNFPDYDAPHLGLVAMHCQGRRVQVVWLDGIPGERAEPGWVRISSLVLLTEGRRNPNLVIATHLRDGELSVQAESEESEDNKDIESLGEVVAEDEDDPPDEESEDDNEGAL